MSVTIGKTGTIRLDGEDLTQLRIACMERDGWRCVDCLRRVSDFVPEWHPRKAHMAHRKSRGAGGSDVLENVDCKCGEDHRAEHNGGRKIVPSKA